MVSVLSLWLPILLSAVFVFIASSLIHMVLGYHNSDYAKLPKQDEVMDALRPFNPSGRIRHALCRHCKGAKQR